MNRLWLPLVLLSACAGPVAHVHAPDVKVWGAVHAIMAQGKVGPTVTLAELPGPHLYGLGALSELRGELLILDDQRLVGYPDRLDPDGRGEKATLLVAATVPAWVRTPIREDIPAAELDARIAALAVAAGLDVSRPFPFRVEGHFKELRWHIHDGENLPATATHDERMAAARRGTLATADGAALGFFSTGHGGVFTHMGRHTHVHAWLPSAGLVAHCEEMGIAAGSVLLLPAR